MPNPVLKIGVLSRPTDGSGGVALCAGRLGRQGKHGVHPRQEISRSAQGNTFSRVANR